MCPGVTHATVESCRCMRGGSVADWARVSARLRTRSNTGASVCVCACACVSAFMCRCVRVCVTLALLLLHRLKHVVHLDLQDVPKQRLNAFPMQSTCCKRAADSITHTPSQHHWRGLPSMATVPGGHRACVGLCVCVCRFACVGVCALVCAGPPSP